MTGSRFEAFTRRQLLASAMGTICAFASDFWSRKDPSSWSPEEIHQLLHKSPWARPVTVVPPVIPQRFSPSTGAGTNASDRSGPGDVGQVARPNLGEEPPNRGLSPVMPGEPRKGIVRWESAPPLLAANRKTLADAFAGHLCHRCQRLPDGQRGQRERRAQIE
jgi:hypothetical protein